MPKVIATAPGTPRQVRERLRERLVEISDLWLPSRAELHRWHDAGAPMYVRFGRGESLEIGPRLETMPASRFSPTWRCQLRAAAGGGTEIVGSLRFPWSTQIVLALFAIMVAGWGAVTLLRFANGETHAGWVGAWTVTALITLVGPAAAWRYGRAELERERPWLQQALADAPLPDEDW